MSNYWWRLPGPTKFLQAIISDIRSGKNVIVCLPEIADNGLVNIIHRGIKEEADLFVRRLQFQNDDDPYTFLVKNLLPQDDRYFEVDINNLVENEDLSRTLVIISNPSQDLNAWSDFLQKFQHLQKKIDPIDRCLLCIVHHEVYPDYLPKQDVCLGIHSFIGINSEIDLEFYLHQIFNRDSAYQDIINRLIISIAGQIVTDDPELCDILINQDLNGIIYPFSLLKELCIKRNWTTHLNTKFLDKYGNPDKKLINLGLLSLIGGVPKLHPCCLTSPERKIELVSRIWSGQVRVLLPHLEITRHKLLSLLKDMLTIPHKKKLNGVIVEIDNLDDLEFGDIEFQLIDKMRNKEWYPEKGMIELVGNLKNIRNNLSHQTPVDADIIINTVKMVDDILL